MPDSYREISLQYRKYETLLSFLAELSDFGNKVDLNSKDKFAGAYNMVKFIHDLLVSGRLTHEQILGMLGRFSEIINRTIDGVNSEASLGITLNNFNDTLDNPLAKKYFFGQLQDEFNSEISAFGRSIKQSLNYIFEYVRFVRSKSEDHTQDYIIWNDKMYSVMSLYFVDPKNLVEADEFCQIKPVANTPRIIRRTGTEG